MTVASTTSIDDDNSLELFYYSSFYGRGEWRYITTIPLWYLSGVMRRDQVWKLDLVLK
jgi:hypothetical protein